MFDVILDGAIPIKNWVGNDALEKGAREQALNISNLPFAFHHVAIMPDSHQGYGMPIGGVLATRNVVIPNAVGVDIGCGMSATAFDLPGLTSAALDCIVSSIRQLIPVGNGEQGSHHYTAHKEVELPNWMEASKHQERASYQLGTLGGGNHFIEIQQGDDGQLWLMIHSGSRALGHKVASYYNNLAERLNARWYSHGEKKDGLAFLPINSPEGRAYREEMEVCIDYAKRNRAAIAEEVVGIIHKATGGAVTFETDISHNYAEFEHHYGQNVMVHRKGACRAREGEFGIIPGNQGANSFIVTGKGEKQSFMSSSHGAGRKMGRKAAIRSLNFEDEKAKIKMAGNDRGALMVSGDLDEAPGAYKDIHEVMAKQTDLVNIEVTLTPLATIKGTGASF